MNFEVILKQIFKARHLPFQKRHFVLGYLNMDPSFLEIKVQEKTRASIAAAIRRHVAPLILERFPEL